MNHWFSTKNPIACSPYHLLQHNPTFQTLLTLYFPLLLQSSNWAHPIDLSWSHSGTTPTPWSSYTSQIPIFLCPGLFQRTTSSSNSISSRTFSCATRQQWWHYAWTKGWATWKLLQKRRRCQSMAIHDKSILHYEPFSLQGEEQNPGISQQNGCGMRLILHWRMAHEMCQWNYQRQRSDIYQNQGWLHREIPLWSGLQSLTHPGAHVNGRWTLQRGLPQVQIWVWIEVARSGVTDKHILKDMLERAVSANLAFKMTALLEEPKIHKEWLHKAGQFYDAAICICKLWGGTNYLSPLGSKESSQDPNAMDINQIYLTPVQRAEHIWNNKCFICHKIRCSTKNNPGNWGWIPICSYLSHNQQPHNICTLTPHHQSQSKSPRPNQSTRLHFTWM